jgi:hypothetical protein
MKVSAAPLPVQQCCAVRWAVTLGSPQLSVNVGLNVIYDYGSHCDYAQAPLTSG